jgi:hypothetical protein
VVVYVAELCLTRIKQTLGPVNTGDNKRRTMQNFVLSGKAKNVFRLIELKAKQEEAAKREKKDSKNRK